MLLNPSSVRTYDLRTRPRSGTVTQSRSSISDSPDAGSWSSEAPPHYEGTASNTETTGTARLYSDTVASRPPSPQRERLSVPSLNPVVVPDRARKPDPSTDGNHENCGVDP